jgi:hypothetical protein
VRSQVRHTTTAPRRLPSGRQPAAAADHAPAAPAHRADHDELRDDGPEGDRRLCVAGSHDRELMLAAARTLVARAAPVTPS